MNVEKYLERIGLSPKIDKTPTFDLLRKLQLSHIYSVPYENIDLVKGVPLALDEDKIYEKIVKRHRGGYCFELNLLFERLLSGIGFDTESYFARFWRGCDTVPERRHRITGVKIDGVTYIADVGVGSAAPRIPMRLEEGTVQSSFGESYRFERDAEFGWMLYELKDGEWQKCYSFTMEKQFDIDFEAASYYCEKHPSSKFNKSFIISLKTPDGRITVDGNTHKVFVGQELRYIEENMERERLVEVLGERFGLSDVGI